MKIEDLRIGNLIKWGVHFCELKSFTRADLGKPVFLYTTKTTGALGIEQFEPIKLTEKWLVNFGFSFDQHRGFYKEFNNSALYIEHNLRNVVIAGDDIREIEYVHELQNLYYALSGKEINEGYEILRECLECGHNLPLMYFNRDNQVCYIC